MSALELYHPPGEVLDLQTGQVLDLKTATLDELAESRAALVDLFYQQRTAASMIDAELVRRADAALAEGETFGSGERFKVYVDRGHAIDYDSNGLRAELLQRFKRGELEITQKAIEGLFSVIQYRLDLSTWKNMLKRWPELEAIGDRHTKRRARRARVKRREDTVDGDAIEEAA